MRNLLTTENLDRPFLEIFFKKTSEIESQSTYCQFLETQNKIMVTFFCEPSTRTRLSFEAAMHRLGGKVISVSDAKETSSFSKGESLDDALCTISQYADLIVLRHPEWWAKRSSERCSVPVINAGNGSDEHPTQALLDMYTMWKRGIDEKNILICGDLLYGRTVHSLVYLLKNYNCQIFLCPDKDRDLDSSYLEGAKCKVLSQEKVESYLGEMDFIYMTRTQSERAEYTPFYGEINRFILKESHLKLLKDSAIIMHPMPRNDEISLSVDNDHRAVYKKEQIKNGLWVRMQVIRTLLR